MATRTKAKPKVDAATAKALANPRSHHLPLSKKAKTGADDAPHCRFCDVKLEKHTSTRNFEDEFGKAISYEEAMRQTNFHVTKAFRYNNEKDQVYACNFWDGESYGYAGESLFCSKTCGHNFARVVAKDLPQVVVNIKARG